MKVINYGPGYEPKTTSCPDCKSEIEYSDAEVDKQCYYGEPCGDNTVYYQNFYETLICPVCLYRIVLRNESHKINKRKK